MTERRPYLENRLKNIFQRLVLATAFPPLDKLYRLIYSLVVAAAVRLLSNEAVVQSLYLRRGYAKGEWLPGLSDLDFLVVVDSLDDESEKRLLRKYSRFARLTLLPDEILEIREQKSFINQLHDPLKKYRLMEGKETWKLLFGRDLLAELPELGLEEITCGLYAEAAIWWAIFSWQLLQSKRNQQQPVICNSICYKAIAEVLKVHLALNRGILVFGRKEALVNAKALLPPEDLRLLEKLEAIAGQRFVWKDSLVLNEALGFLLRNVDKLHNSVAYPETKISARVDYLENEQLWNEQQYDHVDKIINHVSARWMKCFRGASLAPSYCHELDELILIIAIDSQQIPDAKQLSDLYEVYASSSLQSSIHLYLLFKNTAFQVDATYYSFGWRSILSPLTNADVFDLITRSECVVRGKPPELNRYAFWTPIAEEFHRARHCRLLNSLCSPNVYILSSLEFLRMFWKVLQLEIISRSTKKGEAIFSHSLPAIQRGLEIYATKLPDSLRELKDAFEYELQGESCNIKALVPEAVRYLEKLRRSSYAPGCG